MTSAIDPTKPSGTMAYSADLRANLQAAHDEIEALQIAVGQPLPDPIVQPLRITPPPSYTLHGIGPALICDSDPATSCSPGIVFKPQVGATTTYSLFRFSQTLYLSVTPDDLTDTTSGPRDLLSVDGSDPNNTSFDVYTTQSMIGNLRIGMNDNGALTLDGRNYQLDVTNISGNGGGVWVYSGDNANGPTDGCGIGTGNATNVRCLPRRGRCKGRPRCCRHHLHRRSRCRWSRWADWKFRRRCRCGASKADAVSVPAERKRA